MSLGTFSANRRPGRSQRPLAICNCDGGEIYYYASATYPIPVDAFSFHENAYVGENQVNTYCPNFCICDKIGKCYQPINMELYYIDIIPFCEDGTCHLYAVPWFPPYFNRDPFQDENGVVIITPDPETVTMNLSSEYVNSTFYPDLYAIGCFGCEQLKTVTCKGPIQEDPICVESQDFVGLTLDDDTYNHVIDQKRISPAGACKCNQGTRFYWPVPQPFRNSSLENAYTGKTVFMGENALPGNREVAFVLNSFDGCSDMCICSKEGVCYQSSRYSEVHFHPFCTPDQCLMYAVPYIYSKYTYLQDLEGNIYLSADPATIQLHHANKYIHAVAISCNGCDHIKNLTCDRESASAFSHGLIIESPIIGTQFDITQRPSASYQCSHGISHFWEPVTTKSSILIIENGNIFDNESICICDVFGDCFTPMDNSNFYLQFFVICEGITCHIDLESKENLVLTGYMNISTEIFSNGAIKYFSDPQNLENNFVSTKLSNISYIGRSTTGSCNKLLPGFCALKNNNSTLDSTSLILPYMNRIFMDDQNQYQTLESSIIGYALWKNSEKKNFVLFDAANHLELIFSDYLSNMKPLELFDIMRIECSYRYKTYKVVALCLQANLEATHSPAAAGLVQQLYGSDYKIWINIGVNFFFGLIGLTSSIAVIVMILREKELRSPYGILCLCQAQNDICIFLLMSLMNVFCNVKFMLSGDFDIYIFSYKLDLYFIQYTCMLLCVGVEIIKASNRFMALYFPLRFMYTKIRHMIILYSIILVLFVSIGLPIVIIDSCNIENIVKTYGIHFFASKPCSIAYISFQKYFEMLAVLTCLILDICTAYKLQIFFDQVDNLDDYSKKSRARQEKIFFTQNISNLTCLTVFMFPFMAFEYIYGNSSYRDDESQSTISPNVKYVDSRLYQAIRFLYETYCARIIWRSIDQFLSMLIQAKLYKEVREQSSIHPG